MKTCAVITANLGDYDPPPQWADQVPPDGWRIERHYFNDATFPPRPKAMTSRLQPGLLKMLGWQFVPGRDAYIWVDASRTVTDPNYCAWMLGKLDGADLALYRHPQRKSIAEEAEYMLARMRKPKMRRSRYLVSRYEGEWIEEQLGFIQRDQNYIDNKLYASTAFAYRTTPDVCMALVAWWYHKTRYCLHDQLALPYVVHRAGLLVNVIEESVYAEDRWVYSRPRGV